ncbi:hypothetical protein MMC30_005699 [Trapelia coarctata]|nr:hypothetical protein [Trapelia coarctata]
MPATDARSKTSGKALSGAPSKIEEVKLPSSVEASFNIAYDADAESGKARGSGKVSPSLNKKAFHAQQADREKRVDVGLKEYEREERGEERKEKNWAIAMGRATAEKMRVEGLGEPSFGEDHAASDRP